LKVSHLFYACVASAYSVNHSAHSKKIMIFNNCHDVGDSWKFIRTTSWYVINVILLALSFGIAISEECIDCLIARYFLKKLFSIGSSFLQSFINIPISFIFCLNVILDFIKHFNGHYSQLFGFACPKIVQLLYKLLLELIVLFKLNFLFMKFHYNLIQLDEEFFTSFNLRKKLSV
jgi:hypothetical protein